MATVNATGISGRQYPFEVYPWGTGFNAVGAVYLILRTSQGGNYDILYVGQTDDLSTRFNNHHKQPCFDRNRKSHIGVLVEGSERNRLAIEQDLIAKYKTMCND